MRLTIERLRTLVLVSGGLLIVALVAFLAFGRWKRHFLISELPKRLGADIKQEANGWTYTQARGGHTLFKIHASKVVQLKKDGRVLLHDVQIELYGEDGKRVDRIAGSEFEYDQKGGTATAAGPVEISIMRPHVAPAVAPNAVPEHAAAKAPTPLASMAQGAASGQIDVKTSGLTFDQKSGKATTAQRVEFSTLQGSGSSVGAMFDSNGGTLVLDHAVELNVRRGQENVVLHAEHGELERTALTAHLRGATASYRGGGASAGQAQILFRQDGSAVRLDARDGFMLASATGTRVKAPAGTLDFNEKNEPVRGRMEGGVEMDSTHNGQQMHGTAPTADLIFTGQGELRSAHLERGVQFHSEQQSQTKNGPIHAVRDWRSPMLDVDFRHSYANKVELSSMRGTGGVVVTGQTQQGNGPVMPSRMTADIVTGDFGDGQQLTRLLGEGRASLEQTTKSGVHQTTSGDRLEVWFVPGAGRSSSAKAQHAVTQSEPASQVESATVDGHVIVTQQGSTKGSEPQSFRAVAAHAVYEGANEMVHLTGSPRIEDVGFQLAADRIDVSQAAGDAFAHGNVKATWFSSSKSGAQGQNAIALGGQGPGHVVAKEAQFHEATGEATFRGQVRMWQQANSITAPVIVLSRTKQTLFAQGSGVGDRVHLILLTAAKPGGITRSKQPSVIQVWAAELKYSEGERKAVLTSGASGPVKADTGTATVSSSQAELVLLPPGNHAAENGGAAQVDKMTARGHVVVSSGSRKGTGERLVYSSDTGDYVLTGTADEPPSLTDPARGSVTGSSLIFNSRDDSVRIEGDGRRTTTETTVPR